MAADALEEEESDGASQVETVIKNPYKLEDIGASVHYYQLASLTQVLITAPSIQISSHLQRSGNVQEKAKRRWRYRISARSWAIPTLIHATPMRSPLPTSSSTFSLAKSKTLSGIPKRGSGVRCMLSEHSLAGQARSVGPRQGVKGKPDYGLLPS